MVNFKQVNAGWEINFRISNLPIFLYSNRHHYQIDDLVYFTTLVPDTSATGVQKKQHEWTQVRQECYMNDTSATPIKNVDFDNRISENIFSYSHISYMANERL